MKGIHLQELMTVSMHTATHTCMLFVVLRTEPRFVEALGKSLSH